MIEKQTFIEAIEAMRYQYEKDKEHSESIGKIFSTEDCNLYDNENLYKKIIELLRIWFPVDENGHCEISSYCFEMNFGKPTSNSEWETPEMLYERLTAKN
jgi:hypothetical protein